ncbi:uncharacterized protein LOC132261210 [Phlebotomus argentipes]|uniref:uncharacterized protein LOC132261210 n=1 Tax=Phlebotomus argentipes TaxID=94469 RepID=UPI002892F2C1|nr:uncharacterized protein LOC132261210 [Phlebotomus argentipes]
MSRLMWRLRSLVENVRKSPVSSYATFTQRDFQYEDHSHSGTLLNRFAKSIAIQNSVEAKIAKNTIKYSQFYPVQNKDRFRQELEKIASDQLVRLLMFTANYRGNADIAKIYQVINDVDNEVNHRIEKLAYRDVQEILQMFMYLLPNKVTELDTVRRGLQKLIDGFPENKTKENFVQICFYLGLFKKTKRQSEQLKAFLEMYLSNYLEDLDSLQLALVANSAFKATVTISDKDFHQRLISEILSMNTDVDIQLLVTFVKSLRHNKVDSACVLDKIQSILEEGDIQDGDLRAYTHLLALFAENRRIPETFGKTISAECMEIIKEEHEKSIELTREDRYLNPNFRAKDLATFLWCCTNMQDNILSRDDLNSVCNAILWKLRNYEYRYAFDEFVDTLLSFFMLGGKSEMLFKSFFNDKDFLVPPKGQNRIKLDSRQLLLISCLEIEMPEVLPNPVSGKKANSFADVPNYLLEKRPKLVSVGQTLKDIADELELEKIELKLPVRNINIPSYRVEVRRSGGRNTSFWIEILDDKITMADLETPTAFVRLKLRLLRQLEQDYVLVNAAKKEGEQLKECLRQTIKEHLETLDSESEDEVQGVIK